MKKWDKVHISCGKLVLAGEYSLLNDGYGLSLALNRFNTLYWRNSSLFEYKAFYLDKIIKDKKLVEQFNLSGTFKSKIDWRSFYGWGSSGACLANFAKFLNKLPQDINYEGSGIDIYTSFYMKHLLYKKNDFQPYNIDPEIKKHLYFGILDKKVKSPISIEVVFPEELNQIVLEISTCKKIDDFILLLSAHDKIISKTMGIPSFFEKSALYSKYLGTWGGDSVLLIDPKNKENLLDSSLLL